MNKEKDVKMVNSINSYYINNKTKNIFINLKTSLNGLSDDEAILRIKKYGYNEFDSKKRVSNFVKFVKRLISPLIFILLIISILSFLLGDNRSSIIIFVMVLISVTLDYYQENKSEKAVEKLKEKVISKIKVSRNGKEKLISVKNIVKGDIIFLSVGSIIPADCRVIECDDLFVNESSLTGESFPVGKISDILREEIVEISSMKNIVFMGTVVTNGFAKAVVISTGNKTIFGAIAFNMKDVDEQTEFEKGTKKFGIFISRVILILVGLIFLINSVIAGHGFFNSLMFSLTLAVGLTPELLPMILSITSARGSINMSKHGVIVKRLNSIHDFGGMDVLCTDKTGTLTENKIKLIKNLDIYGNDSNRVLQEAVLNSFFQSGLSNPMDEAVLEEKNKAFIDGYKKIDEIPFDFQRRRLSVIIQNDKERLLITKGAPEEILSICTSYEENNKSKKLDKVGISKANELYKKLSEDGFRVLAIAHKNISDDRSQFQVGDENDLMLSGFIAFLDPAKENAKHSLDLLEAQGIEVKIITGDNDLVTKKICNDVGVLIKGILTGSQIAVMSEEELKVAVENTTIFARVSPDQKAQIVSVLKSNNHSVGYLGDGINDAYPLKVADVGISVNTGVDVAKESADLILLTKDLEVLSLGVTEGRKTFGNTTKYILMGLSSNFGNMFSVAVACFALPYLPMIPIQILLNNFLYDLSQITIPFDNVDKEYLQKPKRWDNKLIKKFMITFGPISSIFDILTFVALYFVFHANEALFQTGWFIESLLSQTLVIFLIRTRQFPFWKSKTHKYVTMSVIGFVLLGFIIPFTPLGAYFGFTMPSAIVTTTILALVFVYLIIVEFTKKWIYKKYIN